MYIAVLGYIATNDVLSESGRQQLGSYPKGRHEAPLISTLVHGYLARGHKVLAITTDQQLGDDEPPFVYEEGRLTYVVVPSRKRIFRPNGRRPGRTSDFYRFERAHMLAVLQHYKPDVVHAHWTYEFAWSALSYTPDALITVHDNAQTILMYVRTLERLFSWLMARYVFSKGKWFTAVSPYMANSVQKWVSSPIPVVPNPVMMPSKAHGYAIPDAPIITLVVNGWDDRKNCKNALLAFKGIQQRHPRAILWAFGTAFEPNEQAAAFCREHSIPNVKLFGKTPYSEVLKQIAQSTILLHASLEESFGMVLVEAMSYGIPVVAGKESGAVPWVVQDGGLLVDVTKVDAMISTVDSLLSDPVLYEKLSTKAVRIVKTRFDVQLVIDEYLALLEQCNPHPEPVVEQKRVSEPSTK